MSEEFLSLCTDISACSTTVGIALMEVHVQYTSKNSYHFISTDEHLELFCVLSPPNSSVALLGNMSPLVKTEGKCTLKNIIQNKFREKLNVETVVVFLLSQ
jgi:hypothetical protein